MAGEKKTFSGKKREEFQGAGKKKETGKTGTGQKKEKPEQCSVVEMSVSEKMRRLYVFETFLRGAAREKRAVPEKNTKRHRSGQGDGWHGTSLSLPE